MQNKSVKMILTINSLCMFFASPAWAAAAAEVCCASGDHGIAAMSRSDLGKPDPAVPNYSLVPNWRAHVFVRSGLRFVEFADAAGGRPRAAIAVVDGRLLSLPIGADAVQQVGTRPESSDLVYEDDQLAVSAAIGADGQTTWRVFLK